MSQIPPLSEFNFDNNFQVGILALLLKDKNSMVAFRHLLVPNYFSDPILRQLSEWLFNYFDHYSITPQIVVMRQMVKAYCEQIVSLRNSVDLYLMWVDRLAGFDLSDAEYYKQKIHQFVTQREYMLAVMRCAEKLKNEKEIENIPDIILKAQQRLAKVHGDGGIRGFGMTDEERYKILFEQPIRDCIPSMWSNFTQFCGGYGRKELTVFAGSPNRGKTWVLCHAAVSALMCGRRVIYYTAEMSEVLILTRIYRIMMGFTDDEMKGNISQLNMCVANLRNMGAEILIKDMNGKRIMDIRDHLLGVNATYGWYPDMVVVDYADRMTGGMDDESEQYRHRIRNIYEQLRNMAVHYNMAVVSASQLNRGGDRKDKPTIADLAECWDKAAIADVIWMLGQTEDEFAINRMRLINAKNRNMERGRIIPLQLDLVRGRLVDLSIPDDPSVTNMGGVFGISMGA